MKRLILSALCFAFSCYGESIEILDLDVISYESFISEDPAAMSALRSALLEKGIVGIRGVPTYKEKLYRFIDAARTFSALPEDVKEAYAPAEGDMFLGYEKGKEKFKRPDGKWVVDDLKVSYYAYVPKYPHNKWPREMDLQTPFEDIATLMGDMGEAVMKKIGLIGPSTGISLDGMPRLGRMLYYRKSHVSAAENPYWCGAHFDHGMFTTLLPAFYFSNGEAIPEPLEAGLFVRTGSDGVFRKVLANDHDVMMFQVGEFGQLVSNDAIRATEHRVHKASGTVERYTMALFYDAPLETLIHSTSELTADARYGGVKGAPCTYNQWHEESFKRYIVKEESPK